MSFVTVLPLVCQNTHYMFKKKAKICYIDCIWILNVAIAFWILYRMCKLNRSELINKSLTTKYPLNYSGQGCIKNIHIDVISVVFWFYESALCIIIMRVGNVRALWVFEAFAATALVNEWMLFFIYGKPCWSQKKCYLKIKTM